MSQPAFTSIPALLTAVTGYLHHTHQLLLGPVAYDELPGSSPDTSWRRLIFRPRQHGLWLLSPEVVGWVQIRQGQVVATGVTLLPQGLPAAQDDRLLQAMTQDLRFVLRQMAQTPAPLPHPCSAVAAEAGPHAHPAAA